MDFAIGMISGIVGYWVTFLFVPAHWSFARSCTACITGCIGFAAIVAATRAVIQ